ncbi:MAG: DUF1934 domain-containing protein [Blautia sp.]|nr:DUF1934 domain-containing protein [Blautia sp.]
MAMMKNVMVEMTSYIQAAGTEETLTVTIHVKGEYGYRDGKHFLSFEEREEEYPSAHTKTRIIVSGKELTVQKKGTTTYDMRVYPEKNIPFTHKTPYGIFSFSVKGNTVSCEASEEAFILSAEYEIWDNVSVVSRNELKLHAIFEP